MSGAPARTGADPGRGPAPASRPVSALAHVLVLTDDIERSRDFYERALGMTTGPRPPLEFPGFWLYAGGAPCLHIAHRAAYRAHAATLGLTVPAGAGGRGPIDHLAFAASDHDRACARLAACGVTPVHNDVPGGGPRQLFFDDPDGVRIEINVIAEGRTP
jgi:catechol 2,3-dioxygenase-like lactoylglutathione lyase family enzyme